MTYPDQLGAAEMQAMAALVLCQLRVCQAQLDILGASVAAVHIDRALDEMEQFSNDVKLDEIFNMSLKKDYTAMNMMLKIFD